MIQQNILDLYSYISDPEINSYIYQLCYLVYVTDDQMLKELLYNYAFTNIANYYRLEWTLKAFNEDSKFEKVKKGFTAFLKELKIKHAQEHALQGGTNQKETNNLDAFTINCIKGYGEKQDQIIFYLIEQSLSLKKIEIEKQKDHMGKFLQYINQMIVSLRFQDQPDFRGLTIPFNYGNLDSFLIVNLLEDEFTCFNTAKRVPYKIIIETVNPSELLLIQSVNQLGVEDLEELIPFYDIEKEMRTISQIKIYQQYNIEELKKLVNKKIDFQNLHHFQNLNKIKDKDIYVSKSQSKSIWGEDWNITKEKIKQNSQYGNLKSHEVRQIIIKGGDDLRNELLIMQMMRKIYDIFKQKSTKLFLRPYDIILTSASSGILEFIPNTVSLDKIKRENPNLTLRQFYKKNFENFEEAQKNFAESLAGYSLICYLFQLKDRHNGNILIDNEGHIIHIDFGFVLTLTPGNIGFESAPFKLINEYEELLNGKDSDMFDYYQILIFSGLAILQEHVTELLTFVKLMHFSPRNNLLACLENFNLNEFKKRFHENVGEKNLYPIVESLVKKSSNSWKTVLYDYFQYQTNTIYY
ncbi:unnamed protein product (macronuclear) [Paramecium tetraurelia]|uniref:1-phosphatidylinositol 4-kinase n=1 Tax=Paramecium tetraurelia TaxID=5888 RepID=A0EAN6_PARTE|nr:uncharacterized protein GSPATT00025087001 [Paramecium tetraurelia]CAK92353.1 unnamed protein product [Paramecium tetraurelia]|eukprot:XP_001459750.1 hypothetical protein (macronuclear) [Paramecium tetraurelia strain d4-2]